MITNFYFGGLIFRRQIILVAAWNVSLYIFVNTWKVKRKNLFPGKKSVIKHTFVGCTWLYLFRDRDLDIKTLTIIYFSIKDIY